MKRKIFLSALLALPMIALAEKNVSGLVPCGNFTAGVDSTSTIAAQHCEFVDLVNGTKKVIEFLIYDLATPVAVLMFGYAGFQMVTSGGDKRAYDGAKKIFTNVLFGYVAMLGAYLIIKLIFSFFFDDSYLMFS